MKFYFQEIEKKFISANRTGESADAAQEFYSSLERMEPLKLEVLEPWTSQLWSTQDSKKVYGPALISFNSHTKCCDKIMKSSENPRRGHWATLSFAEITVNKRCVCFIPQTPAFNQKQTLNYEWYKN